MKISFVFYFENVATISFNYIRSLHSISIV